MYNLTPPEPPDRRRRHLFLLFVLLGILAFVIIVQMPAGTFSPVPAVPTRVVSIAPTAPRPTSTPFPIIRTAWIEARETCCGSRQFGELVVPGANLWLYPGPGNSAGRNLPHGTKISIIAEDEAWVSISLDGQKRYVQLFYVVDYDPALAIRSAIGYRFDMLC